MKRILETLFKQYHREVYLYLYSLSHDSSLAEDLAQEVFLEVIKSIPSFRGESDIKTWLFSIARHRWYAHLRQKKRQPISESLYDFYENVLVSNMQHVDDNLLITRFFELLNEEPERTQDIVTMRLEGYSYHEIAIKHGISESSARVIDFRAKTKIRQILEKEDLHYE